MCSCHSNIPPPFVLRLSASTLRASHPGGRRDVSTVDARFAKVVNLVTAFESERPLVYPVGLSSLVGEELEPPEGSCADYVLHTTLMLPDR